MEFNIRSVNNGYIVTDKDTVEDEVYVFIKRDDAFAFIREWVDKKVVEIDDDDD